MAQMIQSKDVKYIILYYYCIYFDNQGLNSAIEKEKLFTMLSNDDEVNSIGKVSRGLFDLCFSELEVIGAINFNGSTGSYSIDKTHYIAWVDNTEKQKPHMIKDAWSSIQFDDYQGTSEKLHELADELEKDNEYVGKYDLEAKYTIEISRSLSKEQIIYLTMIAQSVESLRGLLNNLSNGYRNCSFSICNIS